MFITDILICIIFNSFGVIIKHLSKDAKNI